MNICLVGPHILPGNASAQNRTINMADGLNSIDDVTLELVIPRVSSDYEKITETNYKVHYLVNQNQKEATSTPSAKGKFQSRVRLLSFVFNSCRKKEYDWIIYYPKPGIEVMVYMLIAAFYKIKFCSHLADPFDPNLYKFKKTAELIKNISWKYIFKKSDCVIVISQGLEKAVKNIYANAKTLLIPLLISSKKQSSINHDVLTSFPDIVGHKLVVYGGNMAISSGVLELLDAVVSEDADWKLVISGPNSKNTRTHVNIVEEIKKRKLGERVYYAGYLSKTDFNSLIHEANVLVVPKTTDKINDSNFPSKLAEFLNTGNPVVVAEAGDIKLFLQDQKDMLLYKPGNPIQLAEAISRLVNDKTLAERIGSTGKRSAEKMFSNIIHMNTLYQFFLSATKS